ncbi:hypothetical protein N5J70_04950, partial [Pseudomonas sp. GD03909]|nr:hypothetical protein [Pseudomonas sp. GD03909]
PAYSASAKVICFIRKLGGWRSAILPKSESLFQTVLSRPVGRPSKTEVTKQIAIEAKIEQEFSADIARLASYAK